MTNSRPPTDRLVQLSIVMPSLNQGAFIEEALLSILRQEGVKREDYEVIVIDGGSSDQTLNVLRRFDSEIDYWVSEPDGGQTAALLKGFGVASGAVLGWLCADDVLTPRALRWTLDFFASHPEIAFLYGDAIWISREGQPERLRREIPFHWFIWLNDHNYIPQSSAFWRKGLYESVGGLDRELDLTMDADLFGRFARVTTPRHVGRILSLVRRHPGQKTQRHQVKSDEELRVVRERLGAKFGSRREQAAKFLVAKFVRVAWKILSGGYPPATVVRRIWEREMQRSELTR